MTNDRAMRAREMLAEEYRKAGNREGAARILSAPEGHPSITQCEVGAALRALRCALALSEREGGWWCQDRMCNLEMGLEEIRDAHWPGDDAVDRIRACAARWLDGSEEKLDARARADVVRPTPGDPS